MLYILPFIIAFFYFARRKYKKITKFRNNWAVAESGMTSYFNSKEFAIENTISSTDCINYSIPTDVETLEEYENEEEEIILEVVLRRTPRGRELVYKKLVAQITFLEIEPDMFYTTSGELMKLLSVVQEEDLKERVVKLIIRNDNYFKRLLRIVY